MFELFNTLATYIQDLTVLIAILVHISVVLFFLYFSMRPSIVGTFILLILVLVNVLWQVQFFDTLIVKCLIGIVNVSIVIPLYRRDKSHPLGLKERGMNWIKSFIPNGFFLELISQISKIALFVLLGLSVFSKFWFTTLLVIQLFTFWVSVKAYIVYRASCKTNPTIHYSKTFSVLAPFDTAFLVPSAAYSWTVLVFSVIGVLNRDYRTTFGATDIRKRTNSLENNSDKTIHLAFIIFASCTVYFSNNIYDAIVLLTLASILRLALTEALRALGKLNKKERLIVVTAPSGNKEHYSRLINYLVPSGSLMTKQIKDGISSSLSYVKFFFPKHSSYYTGGKHQLTSELSNSPLLTHVFLSDHNSNEQGLPALKRGLNSVFGIMEIHVIQYSNEKNKDKKDVDILGFLCDEELQDIELSAQELEVRKLESNVNENVMIMSNLARERLEVSGAYESLRLNIKYLESLGDKEMELHESLKDLPFDFFAIHRQLYEIPSHSGRFGEMFHIYEMIMRYLSCCTKIQLGEEYPERGLVSMGATVSELRSYSKLTFINSDFEQCFKGFLNSKDLDGTSVKVLISHLRHYSPSGTKFSSKPTVTNLFDWITTLRNRTKGHGSTSKVDPNLVYALNTLLIDLLIQFKVFNLKFSFASIIAEYPCKVQLNEGGLPNYRVLDQKEFDSEAFQRENTLKICMIGMNEHVECAKWFKTIEGRVYVFDGIDSPKNKIYWYNFLTSTRIGEKIDQD